MGVTLDYLLGGNNAILDKELLKRLEDSIPPTNPSC